MKPSVLPNSLHLESLPPATKAAFLESIHFSFLKNTAWYLAGGTALALQAGHRQSVDLDFFTPKNISSLENLEKELLLTKKWKTTYREKGTLYGIFKKAKMSFISYPFFHPSKKKLRCEDIKILFPQDIAAMKIVTISQRGKKRDFVDMYWYCQNKEPLRDVISRALKQYPGEKNNLAHILKSLRYFDDAELDPLPTIYFKANWNEIKNFFKTEVPQITREFLGLED